ncbi:hypothetical protein NB713_003878 [Xanthomonas sacchari]|nr:hypothetical protein [Xanthomonas sacchari]
MRTGELDDQAGAVERARESDIQLPRLRAGTRHRHRGTALPQRRGVGRGHATQLRGAGTQRLHLVDRHAPVGAARGRSQAQVAGQMRREEHGLGAAQRIGHRVDRVPMLAIARGLQQEAFRIGGVPLQAHAADLRGAAQVDLEPVAGTEGAGGAGAGVAVDQIADRLRLDLLGGTGRLPLRTRRQAAVLRLHRGRHRKSVQDCGQHPGAAARATVTEHSDDL